MLCIVFSICIVLSALNYVHYILGNVLECILFIILCIVSFVLDPIKCALYFIFYMHCILCIELCALYTRQFILFIVFYALNFKHCILVYTFYYMRYILLYILLYVKFRGKGYRGANFQFFAFFSIFTL